MAIADETVDDELKEIFHIHLKTCRRCSENLSSFLAFRKLEDESADNSLRHIERLGTAD